MNVDILFILRGPNINRTVGEGTYARASGQGFAIGEGLVRSVVVKQFAVRIQSNFPVFNL
jgi:hypothetical protein